MPSQRNLMYTVSVFSQNSPGILHRVIVTFTRRKLNVESLTVSETERPGISRYTIVVHCSESIMTTVVKQIRRIVEVRECFVSTDSELVKTEIAFIRVVSTPDQLGEVEQLAHRNGASVAFASPHSIIIQAQGSEDYIRSLYALLEPHGICEFTRSGRIAMRKVPGPRFDGSKVERRTGGVSFEVRESSARGR